MVLLSDNERIIVIAAILTGLSSFVVIDIVLKFTPFGMILS